jgi:4a-hydroxytetrahydrobiopterin dehydratase
MKDANPLTQKKCRPCEGIGNPLSKEQAQEQLNNTSGWQIDESGKGIFRDFTMKNFMAAVNVINKIAEIAESEDHHPDIHLVGYRKLRIDLSTHAIGGLSENDFIVAAKINELPFEIKK